MIFAAATDESTLFVFASVADAIAHCEGIDVDDGAWVFWDHRGSALAADFMTPNHRGDRSVGSGKYRLLPATGRLTLEDGLARLRHIDTNPYFATLSEVRAHLSTANRVSTDPS